ncbi:MAG: hypothetical protein OCC49_19950 [Fibrobacterales bacterium]
MWQLKNEEDIERARQNRLKSDYKRMWQFPLFAFWGTVIVIMLDLADPFGESGAAHQIKSLDDLPYALSWAVGVSFVTFLYCRFSVGKDSVAFLCTQCNAVFKKNGACKSCSQELVESKLWIWRDET